MSFEKLLLLLILRQVTYFHDKAKTEKIIIIKKLHQIASPCFDVYNKIFDSSIKLVMALGSRVQSTTGIQHTTYSIQQEGNGNGNGKGTCYVTCNALAL